jgi:hypothetical protein
MGGPGTGVEAWVVAPVALLAVLATATLAGCDGPSSLLIGRIPDGGSPFDGSELGEDVSVDEGGGASGGADATTSSSSGSSGSSGAGASGSSGANASGSGGGASSGSSGASSGASGSGSSGASGSGSNGGGGSSGVADGGSSGASSGGSSGGSSGSSGAGADGGADAGPEGGTTTCDAGGPLALKSFWTMPAVTPSGVAVDAQGNVYVTGIFNGSVTFGTTMLTGPTGAGTGNMFLVKYGSGGNVVFAKSYGTPTGVYDPPVLAVDPAGDVFLGGAFSGTLSMGGGTTPLVAIALDAFAAKVSPAGTTLWADHFGYDAGPYAVLSIAVGPDGNPVVAGTARGTVVIGGTTWPGPTTSEQPFLAKLTTNTGSVIWSNAAGGDINSGEDIWVAIDATGRVFLAARVQGGGGAWGVEPEAGAPTFDTMRAGFTSSGVALWGQWDYGGYPVFAGIDSAGRFSVVENADGTVIVGGSTMFGVGAGFQSLSLLFSPTDGTVLSGLDVNSTFPWAGAVDGNGNTLFLGTYWPSASPTPVGTLSLPAGGGSNQPLFVAAADGLSHAVGAATLGASNDAQPYAMAVDPGSGNVFAAFTLSAAFTSSVGAVQPGTYLAVFAPDPCNDEAGPLGSATGNPNNHGDLAPDGGSPYVPKEAGAPAACPANGANAVNGAACPVARGCSYGASCCSCNPNPCGAASTTWTCVGVANGNGCPGSPPSPGATCSNTSLQCDYCTLQGRLVAVCTAGGWETLEAQIVCN